MSSAGDPHLNRRDIRRVPRGVGHIECRRGVLGLGPNLAGKLLDISQSGARLTIRSELAVGDEIELVLEGVGSTRAVRVLGEVVRTAVEVDGTYSASVRFSHMLDYAQWQKLT